jgi:hypothetical protein
MFNHRHYVPILKWKMGEYQALQRLSAPVKDGLTPLLEIPPVGFDFETGTHKESADDHLGDFGRRLKSKWQARPCFVDLKFLPAHTRMAGGRHYVEAVFEAARVEGCAATPAVSFANDVAFIAAVGAVIRLDQRGVCLRLGMSDFDRPALTSDINTLLRTLGVGWAEADLVIDLGTPNYLPMTAYVRLMSVLMGLVPALNRWRTLTIAGTAYPSSIAQTVSPPFAILPRHEWVAYRSFVGTLGREVRIPTFGDYAVAHRDLVELDMRMIKPFAIGSDSDRKPTPRDPSSATVCTRWASDRPNRSSFHTTSASPELSAFNARSRPGRSATLPLTPWSVKMRSHPAAFSASR